MPTTNTATTPLPTASSSATQRGAWPDLLGGGVAAATVAAATTTAVAAIARIADIPLTVGGERIPLAAFAVFTAMWTLVGIVMAGSMARLARRPRTLFVRTTVVLTVLSCVPSLTADADTATRVVLCITHVVAAAVVIPALARRLDDGMTQ